MWPWTWHHLLFQICGLLYGIRGTWSSYLCWVVSVAPGFRSSQLIPILAVMVVFLESLGLLCIQAVTQQWLSAFWDYTHSRLHAGVKDLLCNVPPSVEWKVKPLLGNTMTLPVNISILWQLQLCEIFLFHHSVPTSCASGGVGQDTWGYWWGFSLGILHSWLRIYKRQVGKRPSWLWTSGKQMTWLQWFSEISKFISVEPLTSEAVSPGRKLLAINS